MGTRVFGLIIRAFCVLGILAALGGVGTPVIAAAGITVSVMSTGAKGDGTTDDTTAFRTALGQLDAAGGGTLVVPQGTYSVQPKNLVVHSNISVAGTQATIRANQIGFSLFDLSGANISMSGVIIDGNNLAVQGTEIGSGATNVSLSNDVYQNFTQPSDQTNLLYDALPVGIRIDASGNGITIDSVTVQNVKAINRNGSAPSPGTAWDPVARGIWITAAGGTSAENITIKNSTFSNVTPKDDGDCIVIQDSTAYANLQVLHNTFNSCAKRAIKIQVPGAVVANNTINNPFLGNNLYSQYTTDANTYDMVSAIAVYASNVAVFNNTITGVGTYYNAIEIGAGAAVSNVSVQGNSVQMGSGTGAVMAYSSFVRSFQPVDLLTITNNQFSTGNAANSVPNGIRLDPPVTRATIKNNTISNVATPIQCSSPCQAPYPPSIAVPAYFYPGSPWTQLDKAAPTVGIAVMNPNNGPGAASNADYVSQAAASQQAGLAVLGYVYTGYANTKAAYNGSRTIAAVEADIDNYFAWYHVDGIFLDEATNTCDPAYLSYYTTLVTYIKEKGGKGLVALNPGTATGECYLTAAPAADIIVTFEGHYSDYISGSYSQPAWVANYSPSRFWHLVYDTPDVSSMQNAVNLGKQRGVGLLYVTPNGANNSNPWGALPSDPYWTDELDAVQGIQPPAPVGLVNGNFASGLNGWTPFCRTWGQAPLTPASTCGNFAAASAAGLQLTASGTQYNQPYIGVTQTVATSAKAVLGGTVTVNAMDTCNTDGAVHAIAHLLNAAGAELGSIDFYHHPYTTGCTPYLYAGTSTIYYQDMPTWLPGAGPQNFTMDVAAIIGQHLAGVDAAQVAAITVELMNYSDFTRPTVTFDNLSLSGSPAPIVGSISPAAAASGAAPLTLTVTGSNFSSGAVLQWDWNGQTTNLPSSVQSGTQLSATIPASLLSATGVAYVSVISGGAASNQAPFYITNSGATVSGSSSVSGSGSVTTTTAGVSATATIGSGTVTVAQYASNPAPASSTFRGNGSYFDVHVAPGSTFTSLTIQDCSTNGGTQAYWYSPTGGWTLASNQSYNAATGCIAITANNTGTSPTIAQLTGTYFTFTAPDTTPPATTASLAGKLGSNGWYVGPVTLTLAAADNPGGSGVAATSSSSDGGATWQPYTAPLPFAGDGQYTVQFRSTDQAGNVETAKSVSFKIDQTPPTVTYAGNAGAYTVDQTVSITCAAADNLSGVASSTCADIVGPAASFPLGSNTVSATATDNAGNVGTGSTTFTLQVTFASLCNLTEQYVTKQGIAHSLCAKLDAAAGGDGDANHGPLNAYVNEVQAQSGKALTAAQAAVLSRLARAL